jgi:Periplasmic copper-binding protein (NosD)
MIKYIGILIGLLASSLSATEYFVGKKGDNLNDGKSVLTAFETIKQGISSLKPGDTLSILPGEYHEAVSTKVSGTKDLPVLIRALRKGSVLLRGDVDVLKFKKLAHKRFVYFCEFSRKVEAVNERDTLSFYRKVATINEVENYAGTYCRQGNLIYIHTTDSEPVSNHFITISVTPDFGLIFRHKNTTNVTVDGLAFTGYNIAKHGGYPGMGTKWGLYFVSARDCVIRNCTAFLNGGGMAMTRPVNSLIENNLSFANGSRFSGPGGNIICWGGTDTIQKNNIAYASPKNGIRFYSHGISNCVLQDNIAWDNKYGDMWIKGANKKNNKGIGNVALGGYHVKNSTGCIFLYNGYEENAVDNIQLSKMPDLNMKTFFASADNLDFRKRDNKNVRYGIAGLDQGQTVYLGKDISANLVPKHSNQTISSRYNQQVKVVGDIILENLNNLTLRSLKAKNILIKNCKQITIENCSAVKIDIVNSTGLNIEHNQAEYINVVKSSDIELTSNVIVKKLSRDRFSARRMWSCYNSTRPLKGQGKWGSNTGIFYRTLKAQPKPRIIGPFVHSLSATTVDIQWWTNIAGTTTELAYGETADCPNKIKNMYYGSTFHTVSVTGLKPGKTYFFKVASRAPVMEYHSNIELGKLDLKKKRIASESGISTFRTLAKDAKAKIYYVAAAGSDEQDGLSINRAWKTISHAAGKVRPGDTVIVGEGKYSETIFLKSSGDKGRQIKFVAAKGKRVVLDGLGQSLLCSFLLMNKSNIRIEGFLLKDFSEKPPGGFAGGLIVVGGQDVSVKRCFYDGRSKTYTPPFIFASGVKKLSLNNCVWTRAFHGTSFWRCPDLLIENCVFYINQIGSVGVFNKPDEKITIRNCIFLDNVPQKYRIYIVHLWNLGSLIADNNCYYMRHGDSKPLYAYLLKGKEQQPETRHLTHSQLVELTSQEKHSFFANPQLKLLKQLLTFEGDKYKTINNKSKELEYKYNPRTRKYDPISIDDFFANNPKLKNIGLTK